MQSMISKGNGLRSFAKHRVFDNATFRKTREDKLSQFRKKQRENKRNSERRKFKADKSDDKSKIIRSLDVLPRKCAQLMSTELKEQLEAVTYFRRILALDRNPPLAAVYETSVVFPRLAEFLTRFDSARLQTEAAWCITNIACGDSFYIQALIDLNVVSWLLNILYHSQDTSLKEQTLWALCNLSCEDDVCFMFINNVDYFKLLLLQLSVAYIPEEKHCVQHLCTTDNPALSTMRHITIICGQILKVCRNVDLSIVKAIVFTFADLLQSPDDEIIEEICQTLSTVCSSPRYALIALEQGVLSRLLELAMFASHRDSAMASIFCLFANCPESQKRPILYKLYVFTEPNKTVGGFFVDYFLYCINKASNSNSSSHTSKSLLNTLNNPSMSTSLLANPSPAEAPSSSSSAASMSLGFVREILQCIQQMIVLNGIYYEQFVVSNLLIIVQVVIESQSSYEGKVDAGHLLCEILKRSGREVDPLQAVVLLFQLTHCTDDSLLHEVLSNICALFQQHSTMLTSSLSAGMRVMYKNSMHFLKYHSHGQIVQLVLYIDQFL